MISIVIDPNLRYPEADEHRCTAALLLTVQPLRAYYNPSTGRWLSRDPIGEAGGVHVYGALRNEPVNSVDGFGLWTSWPNGGQHDNLTRKSLKTALGAIARPPSDGCKKKMTETLVSANVGQDRGSAGDDLPRHFNRGGFKTESPQQAQQRRTAARTRSPSRTTTLVDCDPMSMPATAMLVAAQSAG